VSSPPTRPGSEDFIDVGISYAAGVLRLTSDGLGKVVWAEFTVD